MLPNQFLAGSWLLYNLNGKLEMFLDPMSNWNGHFSQKKYCLPSYCLPLIKIVIFIIRQ